MRSFNLLGNLGAFWALTLGVASLAGRHAVIQGVTNLAAGAINVNVLAGSAFEFIKSRMARVRFYVVGNAAGDQRVTIQSGSDVLMEESPISRQNRVPIVPDDLTCEDIATNGDRLKLQVRNTGAGAVDTFWRVEVTELA